jgi:Ni/Co efflux regulator RcnB
MGPQQNPPISGVDAGRVQTMSIARCFAHALSPLALAVVWLAFVGPAAAQSQTDTAQQSSEDADKAKAEAEKRRQAEADAAARKAEARKPRRDASKDGKAPERELEEEEDI